MSEPKPLTVTLSPRAAAMLEAMVSDGTFPDVAHAVEGVMDDWAARHDADPASVAALRRLCAEADESGPPVPASVAFDRVRSRLSAGRKDPSAA
ncbi:MAG: hypothetical protein ACK5YI_07305 [Rhodospirillales bacterium]|jgi:Arc/MetJ-type ribon-helix-helix transcriptional regulator